MAQSKRFYDDIKKEIECPLCEEQFSDNNEPKVLQCQHTFCKSCLEGWLRQHRGGALSCPICREITECPNNNVNCLRPNLGYKNLIGILKAYSENEGHDIVSQQENVCEHHNGKVKFYCEQCDICICPECAIVEHRDRHCHNIMSLEEGARKQKANIERKLKQVEMNSSRLRSYASSLKKRMAAGNKSIDQATKELHRVAEYCINSIRQHEARVTELLTTQKLSYDDAFSKQLSELTEKIQGMDNVSALSKEVLQQRNNLQEMLNIKQVLDERIVEEVSPLLNYPEFKYIRDDALPLNLTPGKLYITNTEPSLSVATGNGLTKGTQGVEGTFTITTRDSRGQTTYSEIDKVNVEIKSTQKGIEDIRSVVKDLKDGRYYISYRPKVAGEFSVSIKVREEPIKESPFKLAVTEILQSAAVDLSQTSPMKAVVRNKKPLENQEPNGKLWTDHVASVTTPEIQYFEVEPKFMEVFVKAEKTALDDIERKYYVEIARETKESKISLIPKKVCRTEEYNTACDLFIDLYQQMHKTMKMERFSLKSGKGSLSEVFSYLKVCEIIKNFPVGMEVSKDLKHWDLYGRAHDLEAAFEFLKREKLEVQRE